MNLLDIIMVVIFGFCLIRGIFRGFIKEISSIIGVLGGYFIAYSYYPNISQYFSQWVDNADYQNILSFMILFIAVFFIISMIGVIIRYLMKIAMLGWLDRLSGALFGLAKGILIVSVILVALTTFLPKGASIIKDSALSPHVTVISEKMAIVISKEMRQTFITKIDELKKSWNQKPKQSQ